MKIRYANRFLPGQRRLLFWSYGFWFVVCFSLLLIVPESKSNDEVFKYEQAQESEFVETEMIIAARKRYNHF